MKPPWKPAAFAVRSAWRGRLPIVIFCLASAVAFPESPWAAQAAAQLSDERIDSIGDQVMQHGDFRSMRRRMQDPLPQADADKGFLNQLGNGVGRLFSGLFDSVGDFLNWLFSSKRQPQNTPAQQTSSAQRNSVSMDGAGRVLMVAVIMALLALLLFITAMVIRSRDRRRSHSSLLPDADVDDLTSLTRPPGEVQVSAYEARALQFAAAGNFRAAVRELLLGAMSWIERSGRIRFRRGLTNRDYLRAIWRTTDKRNAFAVIGLHFERIFFGRRDATEEAFQSSLQAFQGAFREEETADTAN